MKTLLEKARRWAPPGTAGALPRPSPGGGRAGRTPALPDALRAGERASGLSLGGARLAGADLSGASLVDCDLDRASLEDVSLPDAVLTEVTLRGARLAQVDAARARLALVDAAAAQARGWVLRGASLACVSLRGASLQDCDLDEADLLFVDAFRGRWAGVSLRGARLVGCDLARADLRRVDLGGADLRGTRLLHADLREVRWDGAAVEGCDLSGARGLSLEQRTDLARRGARVGEGWGRRVARAALGRRAGGGDLERDRLADRVAAAVGAGALAGAAAVGAWALATSEAPARLASEVGQLRNREAMYATAAPDAGVAARAAYADIVRGVHAARARMEAKGGAGRGRWPTVDELANNQFDADGLGPEVLTEPIFADGLPVNPLSPGYGVIEYCNAVAAQDSLTGDDHDWHYCPETGRVFACGGYSTAPTVEWAVEEAQVGPDYAVASAEGVPPTRSGGG